MNITKKQMILKEVYPTINHKHKPNLRLFLYKTNGLIKHMSESERFAHFFMSQRYIDENIWPIFEKNEFFSEKIFDG